MRTRRDATINVEGWGDTSVGFHLENNHNRLTKLEARAEYENILLSAPVFDLTTKAPGMVNLKRISKNNIVTAHSGQKDVMGVWADHGNDSFTLYAGAEYVTFKSNAQGQIYPSATSMSGTLTFDKIVALPQ